VPLLLSLVTETAFEREVSFFTLDALLTTSMSILIPKSFMLLLVRIRGVLELSLWGFLAVVGVVALARGKETLEFKRA